MSDGLAFCLECLGERVLEGTLEGATKPAGLTARLDVEG